MRGLLISPFALCAVNSRARYIRGRGRIVHARSINFTVCVMRGLFEGAVYLWRANYSRKYGMPTAKQKKRALNRMYYQVQKEKLASQTYFKSSVREIG